MRTNSLNDTHSCLTSTLHHAQCYYFAACSDLPNPANGIVEIEGGVIASYLCDVGFTLIGPYERYCDEGVWAGVDPECVPGWYVSMS